MINKLARGITSHPKTVILIAVLLLIPSAIGFLLTGVNYDILSYLPDDLDSSQGIAILDDSFNEASMSIIVMSDMTWDEMTELGDNIEALDNVRGVLWLGSVLESPIPMSMLPESVTSMLYSADGDSTLMLVQFRASGASEETLNTISEIKDLMPEQCLMSGTSAVTYDLSVLVETEAPKYVAIAIVLALIALALTMDSFILPIVLLIALGMAVIYNMGTNFMFGEISFITQSIAAILQLGVTMDYSVFLMDRYSEEKPKYRTHAAAMSKAITSTFTSLAGSSLTTIFGFLALCFMSLTLGLDIGLVMAKGVLFGIITVVIVLPALILQCEKLIDKTRHKSIVPSFRGLNKFTLKFKPVFAVIFVLLLVPSWIGQQNVSKYYNMMDAIPDDIDSIQALDVLKEDFNMASTYFAIIDDSMDSSEKLQLLSDLGEVEGVSSVLGLNSILGTAFSQDILPDSVKSIFVADGKQMIMVNSVYSPATDECNAQVDELTALLKSYDSSSLLTGEGPMYKDLIEVADRDFIITNIISIAAIFVLIAIIFKSISIPFILVLSIELAIWINVSISYLMGEEICFITPTIISCVQLGATVDYAILLTTRFREELSRGTKKKQAMQAAADSAHKSIFQSALVFFAATFGVYLICDIDLVSSICAMLARGSIISALVIMLFLTPTLVICEGLINKTTVNWRVGKNHPTSITSPLLEKIEEQIKKAEKKAAKLQKKQEKAKAKPVPAELVADKLTDEAALEIEKAMSRSEQSDDENED
ncbi:MAG: MMPL family transporter [Clostridiales bacterium]|nr:MMPL family transporter [Clostridiales bacterium]